MTDRLHPSARWLDREALAEYISERVDRLPRLQRAGKLPKPSHALGPRNPRWWSLDVDAIMGFEVASQQGGPDLAQAIFKDAAKSRKNRQEAPGGRHSARVSLSRVEGAR
jgi:hypothetical protein